jgi:hypothetical protein
MNNVLEWAEGSVNHIDLLFHIYFKMLFQKVLFEIWAPEFYFISKMNFIKNKTLSKKMNSGFIRKPKRNNRNYYCTHLDETNCKIKKKKRRRTMKLFKNQ